MKLNYLFFIVCINSLPIILAHDTKVEPELSGLILYRLKDRLPSYFARVGKEKLAIIASQLPHVDVNFQDTEGKTALHYAAEKGYRDLIATLLSEKADTTIQDKNGKTPLMLAQESEQILAESLLKRALSAHGA